MNAIGFASFAMIKKGQLEEAKKKISEYEPIFDEAVWLSAHDPSAQYYWVTLRKADMASFKTFCQKLSEVAEVEQIRLTFKSSRDLFSKLQGKGFTKYEEAEYADFRVDAKNALVSVMKSGDYQISVQRIHVEKEMSIAYFFSLAIRVLEIVNGKEEDA